MSIRGNMYDLVASFVNAGFTTDISEPVSTAHHYSIQYITDTMAKHREDEDVSSAACVAFTILTSPSLHLASV